jgi:hypothetical protein
MTKLLSSRFKPNKIASNNTELNSALARISHRTFSRIYLHQGSGQTKESADLSVYEFEVGNNQRTKPRPYFLFSDHDEFVE